MNEEFALNRLKHKFEFPLRDPEKILMVTNQEELESLPQLKTNYGDEGRKGCLISPDFWKIAEKYDAMYVRIFSEWIEEIGPGITRGSLIGTYYQMYGWDVDSLLVFNPDAIIERE